MQDFRKLRVWQKAHQFVLALYDSTAKFPGEERFGLTSQLRRAAVSIPSNLAEGSGRMSDPEFKRFVQIAMGSASEVEYQLLLAHDLGFVPDQEYRSRHDRLSEMKRMLNALIHTLKNERH